MYSYNIILFPILKNTVSNVYSQHNVYSHNIILLFQDKFQLHEQYHVYQSKYMNDKSNDHSINRWKKL